MKFYRLKELCTDIIDCPHSTPKWLDKGIPVIRNYNLNNRGIDTTNLSFVDEETYVQRIKRAKPEAGDIIISREAPMGVVGMIPENFKCCLGQRLVLLKIDKQKCNPKYLLYSLTSQFVQQQIKRIDLTGSIVSNLNIPDLKNLLIPVIEKQQNDCAHLLDLIDSKIELNNKINDELESMAKTIYDYWFLQFEFPNEEGKPYKSSGGKMVWNEKLKREIPEGWGIEYLGDILEKINETVNPDKTNGLPYTPMDELPIRQMSYSNFKSNEETNISLIGYKKKDILFGSMRAYFHRVCIAPFNGITRTTTFVLKPRLKNTLGYSFETMNLDATVNYAVRNSIGTQQPYAVWDNSLEKMPIVKVPLKLKEKYSAIMEPLINKVIMNNLENQEFASLQDFLLPLLMNGQVRFKE